MRVITPIRTLMLLLVVLAASAAAFGQLGVAITIGPPPLPVYEQPVCPSEGYIWTPGYWAYDYDNADYYWVPGTWVQAPEVGYLWTPSYWGWGGDRFLFHEGYWGPQVGFYGGINYGFGYFGNGYEGGRWDRGQFFYNRSVNNVNITNIHNVYNTTVINNTINRVSYNGGNGGVNARPTSEQEAAGRERHIAPVGAQMQHEQAARGDRQQWASVNHGKPPVAATPKPGAFQDNGRVPAKEAGGPYNPAANRGQGGQHGNQPRTDVPRPGNPVHARDLPPQERPPAPHTGNPKMDTKYQQQQEKMMAKQGQERQKLQQKQDQDHQKIAKQNANNVRQQQVEQKHQQQTQQLQQRHTQQQQHLQQRQQPPAERGQRPR